MMPMMDPMGAASGGASGGGDTRAEETLAMQQAQHVYNGQAVGKNNRGVYESRVVAGTLIGAVVGFFGISLLFSFFSWLLSSLFIAFLWLVRLRFSSSTVALYFPDYSILFTEGLLASLYSFVLLWTLSYAAVHTYI